MDSRITSARSRNARDCNEIYPPGHAPKPSSTLPKPLVAITRSSSQEYHITARQQGGTDQNYLKIPQDEIDLGSRQSPQGEQRTCGNTSIDLKPVHDPHLGARESGVTTISTVNASLLPAAILDALKSRVTSSLQFSTDHKTLAPVTPASTSCIPLSVSQVRSPRHGVGDRC